MCKRQQISRNKRIRIYERDNYTCKYCQGIFTYSFLTVDHILPVSRGGTNDDYNLVTCCLLCNREKSDMTGKQYKKYRKNHPRKDEFVSEKITDLEYEIYK